MRTHMKCFDLRIEKHVAHVVMKRPEKRNSMIREFWEELPQLVNDIDDGSKARVIVIASEVPHFTSGLDTSLFGDLAKSDAKTKEEREISKRDVVLFKPSKEFKEFINMKENG